MSYISTDLREELVQQYILLNRETKILLDRIYESFNCFGIVENPEYMEMQVDSMVQLLHALRKRIVQ